MPWEARLGSLTKALGMHGLTWCGRHAACVCRSVPSLNTDTVYECCNSIACTMGHPSKLAADSMNTEEAEEMLSNPQAALDWARGP